jgi:hypothetical protein
MSTSPSAVANVLSFIVQATKAQGKLRLAVSGPSGSGKTFTGINVLAHMGCKKILVLDTEHGSAAKYANEFPVKFDVIDNRYWQSKFDPRRLIAVLKQVGPVYDGIVCDSLTHFWMGPGGMLSLVDDFAKKTQARTGKYDSFAAWKEADPIYNELVQTILALPCHFVACLRAKSEYEDVVENGKKKKVKVGMASQMREGFEYEFDVEGMMTMNHEFIVGKTRCRALDEQIIAKPGANLAEPLLAWLTDGEDLTQVTAPVACEPAPARAVAAVTTVRQGASEDQSVANDASPPPAEEQVPPTSRSPETMPTKLADAFLLKIAEAKSLEELKAVGLEIKAAAKVNKLTSDEYNSIISPAYSKRSKELKGQAAA